MDQDRAMGRAVQACPSPQNPISRPFAWRVCRAGIGSSKSLWSAQPSDRLAELSEPIGVLMSAPDAREQRDGVVELVDGDGVAAGPSSPGVDRFDLLSEVRELVERVAEASTLVVATQVVVGSGEACRRLAIPVDVWAGVLPGYSQLFAGPFEVGFGHGEVTARGPSAEDAAAVETLLGEGVAAPRRLVAACRCRESITCRHRRRVDAG